MTKKALFLFFFTISFFVFSQKNNVDSLAVLIERYKTKKGKDIAHKDIRNYFKKYTKSEKDLKNLIQQSKEAELPIVLIYAHNSYGTLLRNFSLYEEAIAQHKKALTISKENNSLQNEIYTLNKIGTVYRRKEEIRQALDYHQKALELSDEIKIKNYQDKKNVAICLNSIGNIYISLMQYDLALNQFKKAIEIQEKLKETLGLAINYQNIAFVKKELGDLDGALKNYKISLAYNLKLKNNIVGRIVCGNGISSVLTEQGKPEEALKVLAPILPIVTNSKDQYYISITYVNLGKIYYNLNKLPEAKEYLESGTRIAKKHGINKIAINGYKYLSKVFYKESNYKRAYELYDKFSSKQEKVINEKNVLYVNKLLSDYEEQVKTSKIKNLEEANKRNRNLLVISLGALALLAILAFSLFRYRTIKNDKLIVTLEQESLRSQMNPHFVFNALNSIKLYIIKNDQKNAVHYLNKFAKVIRKILEASQVKEVSLEEELETMRLYLSIENIRFSNEVNYEEKIDASLNLNKVKVPPLILQPFIENAIWHGLSSKKGDKILTVEVFKESQNYFQINITDNGIGRKASAEIKENKHIRRKSIGIDLTKDRLTNFSRYYDNDFEITYIDLEENNIAKGTSVQLKIPLQ